MATGISVTVWTSKDELINAKQGGTTLVAAKSKSTAKDYEITVTLDACEFVGDEVRVNLELIKKSANELGEQLGAKMGEAIGKELDKLIKGLE